MKIILFLIATIAAQNGQCPSADQYCLSCSSTNCGACAYSFLSTTKQCTAPTTKVDGCISYSNATTCSACAPGKQLSANACTNISITNCLAVLNNLCVACANAMRPAADGKSCSTTACTTSNCQICSFSSNTELCLSCKSGYAMDSTTGACVAEKTANCDVQTSTACTACELGYQHKDNTCVKSTLQAGLRLLASFSAIFGLMF